MQDESHRQTTGIEQDIYRAPVAAIQSESVTVTAQPKQSTARRLLWFFAGAGVNYLLIAKPFKYLQAHTTLSVDAISYCSMGVSAICFFFWNYFVNFRTDSRKRDALGRYVVAVIALWFASSNLLKLFKGFNANLSFHLGSFAPDLDVIATQACLGWLKFIVYHKWAFPAPKDQPQAEQSV